MLNKEQEAHFRLFGYACAPGTFDELEIKQITAAFDEVLAESLDGKPFAGTERQLVTGFVETGVR